METQVPSAEFVFNQRYRMTRYLRLTAFALLAAAAVWYWIGIVAEFRGWLSRARSHEFYLQEYGVPPSNPNQFDFDVFVNLPAYPIAFVMAAFFLLLFQRRLVRWLVPRSFRTGPIPAADSLKSLHIYAFEKRRRIYRGLRFLVVLTLLAAGIRLIEEIVSHYRSWMDLRQWGNNPEFLKTITSLGWGTLFKIIGATKLIVPGLILLFIHGWIARRLVPLPKAECPECRHSLRGLSGARCPECGIELPKALVKKRAFDDSNQSNESNESGESDQCDESAETESRRRPG